MTPTKPHHYYDENGNTPDFKELARVVALEGAESERPNSGTNSPVPSFCLAQTYASPAYDTPPATRPGDIHYEKEELYAMAVSREKVRKDFHEDIEGARQQAEARQQGTKKRTDNFTPDHKPKSIRKDSPVYTPSPDVIASIPTPWQESESEASIDSPSSPDPNLCRFCLQSPCDNKEDLDDAIQRLSMYFQTRVYDKPNDIPGNSHRRKTFLSIYKEIVLAKGRSVYARSVPPCAQAAAQGIFPSEDSLPFRCLYTNTTSRFR